jgi:2-(1,2-epoxy-1,2-dihydrophenyl)acetyl-CoA isomerase
MNAWDRQLGEDLLVALEVAADPGVRSVTITGAGRAFSAGADLRAGFDTTPEGHPDVGSALRRYHPVILGIRQLEKPVVAAVNGPAVGIGCSLALACDLVLAAESAYFLLAFVNIGLTPDGGSSVFVPARTGLARAAEMAMLGERVGADQALTWGLVNRVIADDALLPEAEALADRLAAGPTRSYAATKRALNAAVYADLPARLEGEADLQQSLAASADFAEGVAAFTARRPPVFEGR